MRQRTPRQHDDEHLAFIRQLPCVVCGNNISSEAAHIRFADLTVGKPYTGRSEKPDDIWTVPLCNEHHARQHTGNEREFWFNLNVDPVKIAMALFLNSGDHQTGEAIVLANIRIGY